MEDSSVVWIGVANIVVAAGNVLIAGLVGWIVYRQHKLDGDRLRLELFEKRYKVYHGVKKHLSKVLREAKLSHEDIWEFRWDTADGEFLFKEDIRNFLDEVDTHSVDLMTSGRLMFEQNNEAKRHQEVERNHEHLKWLTDALGRTSKHFAPYFTFDHSR